jgi:hypothetical protein
MPSKAASTTSPAPDDRAKATITPAWRNEVAMSSLDAILERAPGRFIDLVAPRLLLIILVRNDAIVPPD